MNVQAPRENRTNAEAFLLQGYALEQAQTWLKQAGYLTGGSSILRNLFNLGRAFDVDFSLKDTPGTALLSWTHTDSRTYEFFRIERIRGGGALAPKPEPGGIIPVDPKTSEYSFRVSDLQGDGSEAFRVVPVDVEGKDGPASALCRLSESNASNSAPNAPSNLKLRPLDSGKSATPTAATAGSRRGVLTWTCPKAGIPQSYRIYRSENYKASSLNDFTFLTSVHGDATSYEVAKLSKGHLFCVTAVFAEAESLPSPPCSLASAVNEGDFVTPIEDGSRKPWNLRIKETQEPPKATIEHRVRV
eukprot:tig00000093_g3583.t1